jgi:hypothetical protein
MIPAGEHFVLIRQIGAAAVDQIYAGQPVLQRDLLGAEMLLHGQGKISSALNRRIIGDDHAFAPRDAADAGDQPR